MKSQHDLNTTIPIKMYQTIDSITMLTDIHLLFLLEIFIFMQKLFPQ